MGRALKIVLTISAVLVAFYFIGKKLDGCNIVVNLALSSFLVCVGMGLIAGVINGGRGE